MPARHLALVALLAPRAAAEPEAVCPGQVNVSGFGLVSIVPTGWQTSTGPAPLSVRDGSRIESHLGSRAYFANDCQAGSYNHTHYLGLNLLGKTMRYMADLSGLGCGCNAAFYLTNMRQNAHKSECLDYYCDANNVCGQSCAEIDVQEASMRAWHSTLHTTADHSGLGLGYGGGGPGWSGPRDWSREQYGPGARCIDTTKPFEVAVSFPVDWQCNLAAMTVTLSQEGHDCPLSLTIGNYNGMAEMSAALRAGMTPIVSYWNSEDMLWMDGAGQDGLGPCAEDVPAGCGNLTSFYDFSIEDMGGNNCDLPLTDQRPAEPIVPKRAREPRGSGGGPSSALLMLTAFGAGALAGAAGLVTIAVLYVRRSRARQAAAAVVEDSELAGQAPRPEGLQRGRPSSVGLLALAASEGQQAGELPQV